MKPLYSVERHKYGFIVKEPFPVSCMAEVVSVAGEGAFIDAGIANYHNAVLCFGQPQHLEQWRFMNGCGVGTRTTEATSVAVTRCYN